MEVNFIIKLEFEHLINIFNRVGIIPVATFWRVI